MERKITRVEYLVSDKYEAEDREGMGRCEVSSGADKEELRVCVDGVEGRATVKTDSGYSTATQRSTERNVKGCDGGCTLSDVHHGMMGYYCTRCGDDNMTEKNEY
jgi:hypothetical protein